jgi:FSR family fosmidomycin resistance protein-like MFS transporter
MLELADVGHPRPLAQLHDHWLVIRSPRRRALSPARSRTCSRNALVWPAACVSLGLNFAVIAAGSIALVAALPLMLVRGVDNIPAAPHPNEAPAAPRRGLTAVLTPTIIGLTGFFALLSLSGSGISNFSVVALTGAFGTPLSAANLALTGYLSAQALGVLLGGFIADLTRRHAEVAAFGYAINACIVLAIGTMGLGSCRWLRPCAAPGYSAA